MSQRWTNFSITLHNLTDEQYDEVSNRMTELQKEMEKKFEVTGGDYVGVESGTFEEMGLA